VAEKPVDFWTFFQSGVEGVHAEQKSWRCSNLPDFLPNRIQISLQTECLYKNKTKKPVVSHYYDWLYEVERRSLRKSRPSHSSENPVFPEETGHFLGFFCPAAAVPRQPYRTFRASLIGLLDRQLSVAPLSSKPLLWWVGGATSPATPPAV
jgi:hypothetical protein